MLVVALAAMALQNDCDGDKKPPTNPAPRQQRVITHPTHRFVLAQPLKDAAFDTQTGQLCRTWDWHLLAERKAGDTSERSVGEMSPTCLSLYGQYPTEGDSRDR